MNKQLILALGLSSVVLFSACKSREYDYRAAYEKAKAQEEQNQVVQETTPVTEPVVTTPAPEAEKVVVTPVTPTTTTAPAATIAPFPIVTPSSKIAPVPIQTSFPICT